MSELRPKFNPTIDGSLAPASGGEEVTEVADIQDMATAQVKPNVNTTSSGAPKLPTSTSEAASGASNGCAIFTVENLAVTPSLCPTAEDSRVAMSTSQATSLSNTTLTSASPSSTQQSNSTSKTTPALSNSTSSNAIAFTSSPDSKFLRGVNLGGWLVLEKWMNPDVFTGAFANAVDQWTFDSTTGAAAALQTHWSTFFTEADIAKIASTGINALRIPIGFWAYDNTGTPYLMGADAFLDQAIAWARMYNLRVWVDLHGAPGSQNGFDNSGQAGAVEWQQGSNLGRTISVLKGMAAKYGALSYADVVVGLELVNEPVSWGNNTFDITKSWAQEAYTAVKAAATNPRLVVVMHDAFEGALAWTDTVNSINPNGGLGIDSHLYQLFTDGDNSLTQTQHITQACAWADSLTEANKEMPVYVGEWSAATNICVNPDGTTTAGTSCTVAGCQCQSADFESWNPAMIDMVRKFVEVQMDVFESSTSGYFMWSAKGPGGWGFLNGIEKGVIPNPVTSREYPGQCGASEKRSKRGKVRGRKGAF